MRRRGEALAVAVVALLLAAGAALAPAATTRRAHVPRTAAGVPRYTSALLLAPTALRDRPGGRVLVRLKLRSPFRSPHVLAVVGRRGAWLRVIAAELPDGRSAWLPTGRVVQFPVDWRLDVSLARRQIVVRRAGKVVRRVTVAVGGPATPTPRGRFAITDKLHFTSYSPYGYGALAFTAHQPQIAQGWGGGDRIAIHGTGDPSSVGLPVSHGCLRAARADLRWLVNTIPLGTPVFVR